MLGITQIENPILIDNLLYFTAEDTLLGNELWVYAFDGIFLGDKEIAEHTILQGPVRVYPNPFVDLLQIDASGQTIRVLSLFDIQGRQLKRWQHQSSSSIRISLNKYPSGTYFIQVYTDTGLYVKKVIKQ